MRTALTLLAFIAGIAGGTGLYVGLDGYYLKVTASIPVSGISPVSGPSAGGTPVTIAGSGFTRAARVDFGSIRAARVTFVSSTEIIAVSPPGTGAVDVTVTVGTLSSARTATDLFTYLPPLSDLTATAVATNAIELTWRVNSSHQTGIEINNGVTSKDVGADSTSYTWGRLSPGTYMCFKIRILAHNSADDSAWYPDVPPYYVCTTTPGAPPAAPSDLTVDAVDANAIELNWQVNSTDQTGFEISNGVTSIDVGAGSTGYTWGGLSPDTYMCFKILAYNSVGDSAWYPDVSPYYVCTTTPGSAG